MRVIKTTVAFLFLLVLATSVRSQTNGWQGIVPGVSTREDAERLLGQPEQECAGYCDYKTAQEYVVLIYSRGPCQEDAVRPFNFPAGVVLEIEITPKKDFPFTDLNLDLKRYMVTHVRELPGLLYYSDHKAGITYAVYSGVVSNIYYGLGTKFEGRRCVSRTPSARDRLGFSCPVLEIRSQTKVAEPGAIVIFRAFAENVDLSLIPLFKWTVSAGAIVGGTGSSTMKLNTQGVRDEKIKITVEVVGFRFPKDCPKPSPFVLTIRK